MSKILSKKSIQTYVVWGFFISLSIWLVRLVHHYTVRLLISDQLELVSYLVQEKNPVSRFLYELAPHRQGAAFVIWGWIQDIIGVHEAIPVWLSTSFIILATWIALKLLRKLSTPHWADIVVPVIFLSPKLHETLFASSNPSHGPFPLLLLFCLISCLMLQNSVVKSTLLGLLTFLLLFSGFGLVIVPLVILYFLMVVARALRQKKNDLPIRIWAELKKNSVLPLLTSTIIGCVLFIHNYYFHSAVECFSDRPEILGMISYVLAILAHSIGFTQISVVTSVSGLVVLGLMVSTFIQSARVIASSEDKSMHVVATTLFLASGYTLLFVCLTAYGRTCLGIDSAFASRYLPYVLPGLWSVFLSAKLGRSFFYHISIQKNIFLAVALVLIVLEWRSHDEWMRSVKWWQISKSAMTSCSGGNKELLPLCQRETNVEVYQPGSNRYDDLLKIIYQEQYHSR